MSKKKKIFFFIVHPSKYHLFKNTIRRLLSEGVEIDIAIVTKDILEDLVKNEGWNYINIIPEGRRNKKLPKYIEVLYFSIKTLYNLFSLTSKKKYDLFITDDLLVVIGRIKGIKTLYFQDDDLKAVPESKYLLKFADLIVSPDSCNLGMFSKNKISYKGNHEIAYLHPSCFKPNREIIKQFNPKMKKYFILRFVSLSATHDQGKRGLDDDKAKILISLLEKHGKVFISSERKLSQEFEKYRISIEPWNIAHALYYADVFIGDSQTMASEAAVLGTPSLRYNDFVGRIGYLEELEQEFGLTYGFKTNNFNELLNMLNKMLSTKDLKSIWAKKRNKFINATDNVNDFIHEVIMKRINGNN